MVWKLRIPDDYGSQNGRSYGDNNEAFTIKWHYNGRFIKEGNKVAYVDDQVAFFDDCTIDEMSMLELSSMAGELNISGALKFYFSKGGVDDTSDLVHITNDTDTLVMFTFLVEKLIGLFVGEDKLVNEESSLQTIDEPLPYMSFNFVESSDSDGEVSIGESSTHSLLYDSEGAYFDEDYKVDRLDVNELLEQFKCKQPKPWELGQNEKFAAYSGESQRLYNGFKVFNPNTDMEVVNLEKWMCFTSVGVFRDAVRKHVVDNGRTLHFPTNSKTRVQAKCVKENCPFYVFAATSKDDPTLQIRSIHFEHDCLKDVKTVQADTRFIVKKYGDKIRRNPKWSPSKMLAEFNDECHVNFHQKQMYRAKRKILNTDCGDGSQQFGVARRYGKEILRSNEGSTVSIKTRKVGDLRYFKRMYICFGALKAGMLDGCRKVILLDGCHIRTGFGGVILTAIGIDANNSMYPFAYAVVEKEKEKSWLWFLDLVKSDLNITNGEEWMVMSDKQKGLVKAVSSKFKGCEHRFCVMHLYSNFKLNHKGLTLKDMFWKAARATRIVDFERTMEELKAIDLKAYEWLCKRPPQNWSKAYFRTLCNSDLLLNNLSESFNCSISKIRQLPFLWMLESIRYKIMEQTSKKKQKMLKFRGKICPRIVGIYEKNLTMSTEFSSHWNGNEEFNVQRHSFGTSYRVHVSEKFCSCRRWQLTGIPCAHAIVALTRLGKSPEEWIDDCYSRQTYLRIYSHYLMPLASMDEWPADDDDALEILPPLFEAPVGRPKEYKRTLQPGEIKGKIIQTSTALNAPQVTDDLQFGKVSKKGNKQTCGCCHGTGHNSRKCPNKPENWVPPNKKRVIPGTYAETITNKKKKSAVAGTKASTSTNNKVKYAEVTNPVQVELTGAKGPNKLQVVRRSVEAWLNRSNVGGSNSQPTPSSGPSFGVLSFSQPNLSGNTSGIIVKSGQNPSHDNYSRDAGEACSSKKPTQN